MEDEVERLRAMLNIQALCEKREDFELDLTPDTTSGTNPYLSSDPDDDEKVLSYEHRVGGRLENAVGYAKEVDATFEFPQYNLQVGEEAPEDEVFCALKALERYPYNYVCAANRGKVARQFFANGNLYERHWDFFYIHSPYSASTGGSKSIILVTSCQVQHFLVTINNALQIHLKIPDAAIESGLLFAFPKDGTPRPRYLGHTSEREMAECLKRAVPSANYRPSGEVEDKCEPTEQSLEAFKEKIELLVESKKKKTTVSKEKKKAERFARQRAWNRQIKRVQRYLGLRESHHGHKMVGNTTVKTSEDPGLGLVRSDQAEQSATKTLNIPNVTDVGKPKLYTQEGSVVFICIDIESFERDHNLITEIGIATLDTADIAAKDPGKGGINWMNAISARHFRVKEYEYLKNKDFLIGCPEHFQFGESEWISIKSAPHEISKCFKPPYSNRLTDSIERRHAFDNGTLEEKRNIILVGHDVMSDVAFLRKLGYDPYNLSNLQELIDTSSLYRAFMREPQPRNLGFILANLDIAGWYLHNAGNDAVYTLQAMISIALKAPLERPTEESLGKETEIRIAELVQNAAEAAHEAQEGWSSDGSDGGAPVAPVGHTQLKGNDNSEAGTQGRNLDSSWRPEKVRYGSC